MRVRLGVLLLLLVTGLPTSNAAITFNFTYSDTTIGFNDPVLGAARRATVEAVAAYVNTVVDHDGIVDINWNTSSNDAGSLNLGSMGTSYFLNAGFSNGLVFAHATTGIDPFPGGADGSGQINFGHNWNTGLAAPTGGQFDLFSVVLHELTHAMGVASLIDGSGGFRIPGTRSVYDSLLETGAGNALVDVNGNFIALASDLTSNNLFLDMTATGGGVERVFAPATFASGSSLSHFDSSLGASVVMQPSIGDGVMRREYSAQDRAILRAIGWNVRAVPEPGGMLVIGIVVALGAIRRRR